MSTTSGLACVTAVYGAYDEVKHAPPGFDDCVLVTDQAAPRFGLRHRGWRVISLPVARAHPRLAAKIPKCRPDWFTDADASVWIDGSFRIRDTRLAGLARKLLANHDLIVSEHPESVAGPTWEARNCLLEEAVFSADRPKYVGSPVVEQAEHYLKQGMPRGWGLWALGIIGRNHTKELGEFGLAWLLEIERWTVQDQVSFPYLIWQREIALTTWPFHQLQNELLDFVKHPNRHR